MTEAPNNVDRIGYSVKDSKRFGQNLGRNKRVIQWNSDTIYKFLRILVT